MKRYAIAEMSDAVARDDGKAIKFSLTSHSGPEFEFECPPEAVPVIVARLTHAMEQAAKYTDPSPLRQSNPITVVHHEVVGNLAKRVLVLKLFPTPHCGIPFALTPEMAQNISSNLGAAGAKVAPEKNPRSLS